MSASKAKGTSAETAVVNYLIDQGFTDAERRALKGANDKADVAGIPGTVIEVKNHARLELATWLDEALREGRNAHASVAVVWHKRRGKGNPADWYVTMTGAQFVALLKDETAVGFAPESPHGSESLATYIPMRRQLYDDNHPDR